jgi:hypothetical protein
MEGVSGDDGEMDHQPMSDDDSNAGQTGADHDQHQEIDDDVLGAKIMGISVKEFKRLAEETKWFGGAPTPEAIANDDEV